MNLKESFVLFANCFQTIEELSKFLHFSLLLHCAFVFTQDLQFEKNYESEPIIMIAVRHNSTGNNLQPKHFSVTAWIEVISHIFASFPKF